MTNLKKDIIDLCKKTIKDFEKENSANDVFGGMRLFFKEYSGIVKAYRDRLGKSDADDELAARSALGMLDLLQIRKDELYRKTQDVGSDVMFDFGKDDMSETERNAEAFRDASKLYLRFYMAVSEFLQANKAAPRESDADRFDTGLSSGVTINIRNARAYEMIMRKEFKEFDSALRGK